MHTIHFFLGSTRTFIYIFFDKNVSLQGESNTCVSSREVVKPVGINSHKVILRDIDGVCGAHTWSPLYLFGKAVLQNDMIILIASGLWPPKWWSKNMYLFDETVSQGGEVITPRVISVMLGLWPRDVTKQDIGNVWLVWRVINISPYARIGFQVARYCITKLHFCVIFIFIW